MVTRRADAMEFEVPGLEKSPRRIPDPTALIGTTQRQYGYLSTSIDPVGAPKFRMRICRIDILVPAGHKYAWLKPISRYQEESEVLIQRDAHYFIQDVYADPDRDGAWIIEAETSSGRCDRH